MSQSTSPHEAAIAREKVARLIAKHALTAAELAGGIPATATAPSDAAAAARSAAARAEYARNVQPLGWAPWLVREAFFAGFIALEVTLGLGLIALPLLDAFVPAEACWRVFWALDGLATTAMLVWTLVWMTSEERRRYRYWAARTVE